MERRLATILRAASAAAVLAGLAACGDGPGGSSEPPRSLSNVSYGPDPAQVMDLELPAGRTRRTPVIVFIHGGAWSGGDKSFFLPIDLDKFVVRGYATANINYRLAGETVHDPILSQDVTAALDFIAAHADEYQVAPASFGLVGHSAGAHLALLAGYKYNPDGRIKAVASLAGPTDLTDPLWLLLPGVRSTIENYLGVSQVEAPERWTGASPVSVATGASPPTILIHGLSDLLVPYRQAERLHLRLQVLQVPTDYRLFPTYGHDLGYFLNLHFPDAVWNPIFAWFESYVR